MEQKFEKMEKTIESLEQTIASLKGELAEMKAEAEAEKAKNTDTMEQLRGMYLMLKKLFEPSTPVPTPVSTPVSTPSTNRPVKPRETGNTPFISTVTNKPITKDVFFTREAFTTEESARLACLYLGLKFEDYVWEKDEVGQLYTTGALKEVVSENKKSIASEPPLENKIQNSITNAPDAKSAMEAIAKMNEKGKPKRIIIRPEENKIQNSITNAPGGKPAMDRMKEFLAVSI